MYRLRRSDVSIHTVFFAFRYYFVNKSYEIGQVYPMHVFITLRSGLSVTCYLQATEIINCHSFLNFFQHYRVFS